MASIGMYLTTLVGYFLIALVVVPGVAQKTNNGRGHVAPTGRPSSIPTSIPTGSPSCKYALLMCVFWLSEN